MYDADNLIPLSALQHYLYCPRQCALIHVERQWAENVFTAKGRILHDRTDSPVTTVENGIKVARALHVWSQSLGVYGVCDVVEFREGVPRPVEYKRGKPKSHRADEVQVCAQAIALEEIFNVDIDEGMLFYGRNRRRFPVTLDRDLRTLTAEIAARCHELIMTATTPAAEYDRKRCSACSLQDVCVPRRQKELRNVDRFFARALEDEEGELP